MADKTGKAAMARFNGLIARAKEGSRYLAAYGDKVGDAVIGFTNAMGQYFIGWEEFDYCGKERKWRNSLLLDGWRSCLTVVPMYFINAHFSNRPHRNFPDRAETGDFALTLSISLNRNCWRPDINGEKSGPLDARILASPYRGPRAAVNVYRAVKSNPKSPKDLEGLRNRCGWIGENGPKMRWVRTRSKFLEGWAGDFSLAKFLNCPEVLAGKLKKLLGLSSGCPRAAFRLGRGPESLPEGARPNGRDTEFETSSLGYNRYLIDQAENGSRHIVRYARALGESVTAFERSLGLNFLFWKDSGKIAKPERAGPLPSQHAAGWHSRVPLFFTEHAFSNLKARRFGPARPARGTSWRPWPFPSARTYGAGPRAGYTPPPPGPAPPSTSAGQPRTAA
ncbi:MAG: hypothetical protein LBW85_10920 [Deltaproteobacteria bacterium]|jgi:hypothetical protein|nr:hypothetical protein [Deltaproteobacteria bacterium]